MIFFEARLCVNIVETSALLESIGLHNNPTVLWFFLGKDKCSKKRNWKTFPWGKSFLESTTNALVYFYIICFSGLST